MDEATVRSMIVDHYAAAGSDELRVAAVYSDNVILDFPQGGERIRGKANIPFLNSGRLRRIGP